MADCLEGAFRAFDYVDNPESLRHAAVSMREVFGGLGVVLRVPEGDRDVMLGNEFNNLKQDWKSALGLRGDAPVSDGRPDQLTQGPLAKFQRHAHALFVKWEAQTPGRAARHERIFAAADPSHRLMPPNLRQDRYAHFEHLDSYMNGVVHRKPTSRDVFAERLGACERLLRDLVRPPTTDARRAIDELLRSK